MICPNKEKEIKTIGVFAPSSGIGNKLERFKIVKNYLEDKGYKLKITKSVLDNSLIIDNPEIRIKEFEELLKDNQVDVIFCSSGGEFALELAPFINFELLKKYPKYIIGFSDSTIVTYLTTVNADIESITSYNLINLSKISKHESVDNLFKIINGENICQKKYEFYGEDTKKSALVLNRKAKYKCNKKELNVSARIIGGTIECLSEIIGMPYDNTKSFINKYKEDGFIWYFDICEMNSNDFYRTLLRMKQLGYFINVKAVLVGRKTIECNEKDIKYSEALQRIFGEIPIIEDIDLGHTYPKITIKNGAIAHINYRNNDFSISFE